MIEDIDKDIKQPRVTFFADNVRISASLLDDEKQIHAFVTG